MRAVLGAAILLLAPLALPASASASTPRHYDCTKAGNANKAACKAAAKTPPSSPMAAAPPVAPQPTASSSAASQPAATGGAPRIVAWTEKNGKVVHYDCSKRGNFNKKACKQ